ncbi:MAG: hypothetical protein EXR86_16030 [Gammaproteobacteria bacterium]|nr:hypothetical protein [Gammaproteobacteria bacterium]
MNLVMLRTTNAARDFLTRHPDLMHDLSHRHRRYRCTRAQLLLALSCALSCFGPYTHAIPSASSLFATLRSAVYQVRVIDIASGDKTTIGSGF